MITYEPDWDKLAREHDQMMDRLRYEAEQEYEEDEQREEQYEKERNK